MADIHKLLAIFTVLACLLNLGHAQCSLSDIVIHQRGTGNWIHGQPEFEVMITKTCPCQESNVKLNINGFRTLEPVDSSILDEDGYVNNKMPLPSEGLTFKYAWNAMFPFKPISSQVSCS